MPVTFRIISRLHRFLINPRTLEPRRGVFGFLYYGIGGFAALIVIAMVLICLEAYNLNFARDFLYRRLGEPLLSALESLLF
jgi:hypothetical protein